MNDRTLNEETDRLNDALDEVEYAIFNLRIGVMASIELDAEHQLVWQKEGGNWHLFIRHVESDSFNRLRSAGRRHRVLAAGKLDELLLAIRRAEQNERDGVAAAIAQASLFAQRVRLLTVHKHVREESSHD